MWLIEPFGGLAFRLLLILAVIAVLRKLVFRFHLRLLACPANRHVLHAFHSAMCSHNALSLRGSCHRSAESVVYSSIIVKYLCTCVV